MDNSEALQLLEELDQIRVSAGMPRMDENSRRDFLKKMGAGAATAGMAAAGMAPGAAQAGSYHREIFEAITELRNKLEMFTSYAIREAGSLQDMKSWYERGAPGSRGQLMADPKDENVKKIIEHYRLRIEFLNLLEKRWFPEIEELADKIVDKALSK